MWLGELVLPVQSRGPEPSTTTQQLPTVSCSFRSWRGQAGDSSKQQVPGSVGNSSQKSKWRTSEGRSWKSL